MKSSLEDSDTELTGSFFCLFWIWFWFLCELRFLSLVLMAELGLRFLRLKFGMNICRWRETCMLGVEHFLLCLMLL